MSGDTPRQGAAFIYWSRSDIGFSVSIFVNLGTVAGGRAGGRYVDFN
jgi:hypothetical protein